MMLSTVLAVAALAALAVAEQSPHHDPSGHIYRDFSLIPPLLSSGMSVPNWEFVGNAVVTDEFVRLTPDRQSKQGGMWNARASHLQEWEITFRFKVHGQGKHLFGDGFAFWYTSDRNHLGPVFGSKDHFHGLGVLFDTYNNNPKANQRGHPHVSAVVNDGSLTLNHDAENQHNQFFGCQAFFRNVMPDTYARVVYRNKMLKVLLDVAGDNSWEPCLILSDISLPTGYYFGFSAATGELADNHDIISVYVSDPAPLTPEEEVQNEDLRQRQAHHAVHEEIHPTEAAAEDYYEPEEEEEEEEEEVRHPTKKSHKSSHGFFSGYQGIVFGVLLVAIVICGLVYWKMQTAKAKRFSY